MIVVHPTDPSTRCLSPIYEGLPDVRLFSSLRQRAEIIEAIRSAPLDEPVCPDPDVLPAVERTRKGLGFGNPDGGEVEVWIFLKRV